MENVTYYAGLVFELAEEFFAQEHYAAAKILYENVAFSEKHQHSERLAVCQYRLFKIRIGDDQPQNLRAATLFEPYVERLDEIDQLDALKDLANVYRSLREWDQVEEVAGRMKEKARIQYSIKHQHTSKREASFEKLSRPLFVYITYADLLCASVCEAREDYQQALQYTDAYANLDWVKETDEDTVHWMNLFQHWAEGNTYVNKLLSGDVSVLQDYVQYIDTTNITNTELVTKLLNVLIAANRYDVDVDHILWRFDTVINSLIEQEMELNEIYAKQVIPEQFVRFGYELAYYYLYRSMYSYGYKYLMYAMSKSHIINNKTYFLNCMGLFLHFQEHALPEIKDGFLNLVEKVWLNNDEKIGNTIHRS
nr:transcriptional regulator [Paenibacillus massiliensis]